MCDSDIRPAVSGTRKRELQQMQQERTEQLALLWTQSQSVVGAYILSLVRDFHVAEDLLQQVAVVLVREFEKYDPARPFLPWALGIAKNTVLKSRRDMARAGSSMLDQEVVDRVQAAFEEQSEGWAAVRQALRSCLEKQSKRMLEVLRWRYAYDLKPQEMAHRMGVTSGAVRVMLHRARAGLRECIDRKVRTA